MAVLNDVKLLRLWDFPNQIGDIYDAQITDGDNTLAPGGDQTIVVGGTNYQFVRQITLGSIDIGGQVIPGTLLMLEDPENPDGMSHAYFMPSTEGQLAFSVLEYDPLDFPIFIGNTGEPFEYSENLAQGPFFVDGTSGDDAINAGYVDADGDQIDANDNFTSDNDDIIFAGSGADTITGGAGEDVIFGQDGDDVFIVDEPDGFNWYSGGEGGETNGDTLDASQITKDLIIDMGKVSSDAHSAFVLDMPQDGQNSITHYGPMLHSDSGRDLGVNGSSDQVLEQGSGQDGTGQTLLLINGVVYTEVDTIHAGTLTDTATNVGVDGYFVLAYAKGSTTPTALFLPKADQNAALDGIIGSSDVSFVPSDAPAGDVTYSDLNPATYEYGSISLATKPGAASEFIEMENIIAGSGNDSIIGNDDDLTIDGNGGDDTINAGRGDDTLTGGDGNDIVNGGAGNDSISGGAGDNTLTGGVGNDTITGGSGVDNISGGGDNDLISAGSGDDIVHGGDGDDTIDGGDGNDELTGGEGDNTLTGGSGNDTLRGGTGADTISGGGDDDMITSGAGNDSVDGGDGTDYIDAGDGNDTIVTSGGNDTLIGGSGNDLYKIGSGKGTTNITDFAPGLKEGEDQDVIDLKNYYQSLKAVKDDFADDGILNQSNSDDFDYSDFARLEGDVIFGSADDSYMDVDDFTNANTNVPCFADTVMVMTDMGERMVGELGQGDMVLTMDSGYAPVRWIGQRSLDAAHFAQHPAHRPIRIRQGALGPNMPSRDLIVSPQHRVLVRSDLAHQVTGQPEALVAAKHLLPLPGVTVADDMDAVTYVHIMFDQHEVVFSDGLATESFYTGDQAMAALAPAARAEIMAIFPELQSADFSKTPSARPFLDGEQGVMLAKAHKSEKRALLA